MTDHHHLANVGLRKELNHARREIVRLRGELAAERSKGVREAYAARQGVYAATTQRRIRDAEVHDDSSLVRVLKDVRNRAFERILRAMEYDL